MKCVVSPVRTRHQIHISYIHLELPVRVCAPHGRVGDSARVGAQSRDFPFLIPDNSPAARKPRRRVWVGQSKYIVCMRYYDHSPRGLLMSFTLVQFNTWILSSAPGEEEQDPQVPDVGNNLFAAFGKRFCALELSKDGNLAPLL